MKKYILLTLPIEKNITDLSETEARVFNEWFVEEIPIRLKILLDYIKSEDEFLASKLDFSPASLILLGKWLEKKISTRKATKEEIKQSRISLSKFPGVASNKVAFTEETYSLCFDIGIYFGTIFVKKYEIKWSFVTKPKNFINRNWPILEGKKIKIPPIALVNTFVAGLNAGTYNSSRLKEVYDYWEMEVKNDIHDKRK